MLRSLGFGFAVGLLTALGCGGESRQEQRRAPQGGGGRAQAGKGGASGSSGGCVTCGGSAEHAGRAGSGGSSGGTGAAAAGGRASQGGAVNGGSAGSAGSAGSGEQAGDTSEGGRAAGGRAQAGTAGDASAGMAGDAPVGDELAIVKVAAYQAVEVTLFDAGAAVSPNAPIVAARALTLRVFVSPSPEFELGTVSGELTIKNGSAVRTMTSTLGVTGPSQGDTLGTTLNFELATSDVTETTLLSLVVRDGSSTELTHWPASAEQALGALTSNGPLGIVLVPLVSNGYTPVVDSTVVTRFSRYMNDLYPASSVELTTHDPVTLAVDAEPSGYGWDEALDQLLAVRDADDPDARIYYYGLLTPAGSLDEFCATECIVGLSNVAGRNQETLRGSIGTGFFDSPTDTFSQETMGHELGHAMGRDHAPCGNPDYPDRNYPYGGGALGVLGFDGQKLIDPFDFKDVMGYCEPVWISDYTWQGLFARISYVNGLKPKLVGPRAERPRQRTLIVGREGTLRWGSERASAAPPDGEPVLVELLDEAGVVMDEVAVPFAPFDHLPGGFLSVPLEVLATSGAASLRVGGELVALP